MEAIAEIRTMEPRTATREQAQEAARKLERLISLNTTADRVTLDFRGVEYPGLGFLDEFLPQAQVLASLRGKALRVINTGVHAAGLVGHVVQRRRLDIDHQPGERRIMTYSEHRLTGRAR